MIFHRFLLTSLAFSFIAIVFNVAMIAIISPFSGKQHTAYATYQEYTHTKSPPTCPDAPHVQPAVPFLDFCSPKAGPFGSHIVLVGENLGELDAWMMTKDQSITGTIPSGGAAPSLTLPVLPCQTHKNTI